MGGSSLGPEVLGETFGRQAGWPRFHMLDSTDPAQIKAIEKRSRSRQDAVHRLLQVRQHARAQHLHGLFPRPRRRGARQGQGRRAFRRGDRSRLVAGAARQGTAVSPTSSMACLRSAGAIPCCRSSAWCRRRRWASTSNASSRRRSRWNAPAAPTCRRRKIPGVQLGVAMGVAATRFGRDKVTIIASPGIADLGAWLEQLLAESTGKQGRGLIPLAGEPLAAPDALRQRPVLRLSRAGRASRSVAAPGGGGAGAGRPSGRADQRQGHLAYRPGILPLGDRHRRRRRDHRHRSVRPAGRRGEQGQDARADRRIREVAQPAEGGAGVPRERRGSLRRSAQRRRARPAQHAVGLSEEPFRPRARRRKTATTWRCWPTSSATRRTRKR